MTGTFVVHVVYKRIENITKSFYVRPIKTFLLMLVNLEFQGDGCKDVKLRVEKKFTG